MTNSDYFSTQAEAYSRFRPLYPRELYSYLLSVTPGRDRAWDCATGNGQVAVQLAPHFGEVVATDISAKQLAQATPFDGIDYYVAPAHASELPDRSVDLVTIGQALHWFAHDEFYKEVERVARPGAIIAAWTYTGHSINEAIDALSRELAIDILKDYWPKERQMVDAGYRNIPFPFKEIEPPELCMTENWDLAQLLGYYNTWSSTQQYIAKNGSNPVHLIEDRLRHLWGDPLEKKSILWPLVIRAGHLLK